MNESLLRTLGLAYTYFYQEEIRTSAVRELHKDVLITHSLRGRNRYPTATVVRYIGYNFRYIAYPNRKGFGGGFRSRRGIELFIRSENKPGVVPIPPG